MSSLCRIVAMSMDHYPDVLSLWERTEGVMLTDADTAERAPAYFRRNPGISHVALWTDEAGENDGSAIANELVGAVLCGHDGRRGYLHHLAVDSEYRRQGVARELVLACLTQLQRRGITACNLFVDDDNPIALRFWQSAGWKGWPSLRLMTRPLELIPPASGHGQLPENEGDPRQGKLSLRAEMTDESF